MRLWYLSVNRTNASGFRFHFKMFFFFLSFLATSALGKEPSPFTSPLAKQIVAENQAGHFDSGEKLAKKGCKEGHGDACALQTIYILKKKTTPERIAEITELYVRGCMLGFGQACSDASLFIDKPGLPPQGKVVLLKVLQKGCDLNQGVDCWDLGIKFKEKHETSMAKKYLSRGCELGELHACEQLAHIEHELGNKTNALKIYSELCDKDFGRGCAAAWLLQGPAVGFAGLSQARRLLNKECDAEDEDSCRILKILAKYPQDED